MNPNKKQLSNPFSTGGGGGHFEAHIQASFVVLMLTGGYAPCLPCWPLCEIKLQGKIDGFDTDDIIVFVENKNTQERRKLIGQVKHSIGITKANNIFAEVIQAAWNDFNNPDVFTTGKDIIALITGALNATDSHNVQWLLSQARHTKDVEEFYRNVEQAKFSPAKSREKLDVIRHHLKLANKNLDVSDEELYSFLNHFHLLGYDLGEEVGVAISLLHSHISQFNQQSPQWVWSRVVDIVQTWNQDAGTIVPEKLPEDLREVFKQPSLTYIPKELITQTELVEVDWNKYEYATDLALANLIGAWNENNEVDTSVVAKLTVQTYSTWILKAREVLHLSSPPLELKNGTWRAIERGNLWEVLGSRIFDTHLDTFKELAIAVLTERNPSFDLPKEGRYMASIYGKVLEYSSDIRKGLAEGLAILGSKPTVLVNCSRGKAESTAIVSVREIFAAADWILWGSLNSLLPLLAEAAPKEFLDAVEKALSLTPCPFDELFVQEGNSITGRNYLTGLLWALEGVAWDKQYLVRACVILGELASHDPGGNWGNRPAKSLLTILLPWLSQTLASRDKQKVVVKTLCKDFPEVAWKLLIGLLPNQHQTSMGSHKPSWRYSIPEDFGKVNYQEYWTQVSFYADLSVVEAGNDPAKLSELINNFDKLTKPAFDRLIEVLSSDAIAMLSEDRRLLLWQSISKFISKHRRFHDAEWALEDEYLSSIEAVIDKLAPSNPFYLYQDLFSDNDFSLYEENENWEEQDKKLTERRKNALEEIMKSGGLESIVQLARTINQGQVGRFLGMVANAEIDAALLPQYLESQNINLLSFIGNYILNRLYTNDWSWVDEIDKSEWSSRQVSQFVSYLPFTNETWNRVTEWLGDEQGEYWRKTNTNLRSDSNSDPAIEKLIEYGRPLAAIDCLVMMHYQKQSINVDTCVKALLAAVTSLEPAYLVNNSYHNIVKLIKILQKNPVIDKEDLFRVEWAYLPWLDGYHGADPKELENRLASSPEFFCELIRLIYHSNKVAEATNHSSEHTKAMATNAWRLLQQWHTPPGLQGDSSFSDTHFSSWLQQMKEICEESGHLDIALIQIGGVLIHCPPDINGLWINNTVANALNERDAEKMRRGFETGIRNSRGVYSVDPTGKPERELAEQYRQKAEDVENAGHHRLAETLRSISTQ